ncbi:hypothetical protein ACO0LC_10870 [Undibacterium sp. JH2W]|uniref:hypothetical protein n=1 Tax=Undibacterium sp. JH2W TaxID=3413037 RepID=UPI003BF030EA
MAKYQYYLTRIAALVLLASGSHAWASGGTGEYTLDWPVRGELLAYHSSGCADACWVAEVRIRATGKLKARLRCDVDKLYFSQTGKSKERLLPEACASYSDSNDKASLISNKLRLLLQPGQVKK